MPRHKLRPAAALAAALSSALLAAAATARADFVLTEFMASNDTTLRDDFGDASDWIEVQNTSASPQSLAGWRLTDRPENSSLWTFPDTTVPPGGFVVVFASGRDRRSPAATLHTNFALAAAGEYLALVRPDGSAATEFAPTYPAQATDVSFGFPHSITATTLAQGAEGQVGVPASESDFLANFTNWRTRTTPLAGSTWRPCRTGIGYSNTSGNYGTWVHPDGEVSALMRNLQRTACIRLPFEVGNPAAVTSLRLRMRWDDGFIAWVNGVEVARDAAPANPVWNSLATANRNEALNSDWTDFTFSPSAVNLTQGTNILAIQAFNVTANSSDLLILPVLETTSAAAAAQPQYFTTPTPGSTNGAGGPIGPILSHPTATIPRPLGSSASPPATVSIRVTPSSFSVNPVSVRLFHRTMYGAESSIALRDDGNPPDLVANDGTFTALLPTSLPLPGEMLRWRFEAGDTQRNTSRSPPFLDPTDADEYYGTVALNPDEDSSQLTVLHQFIQNPDAAGTLAGTYSAIFYLGHFYDNVFVNRHGQSTASFAKKSHNFDFNRGNRFTWHPDAPRKVKDINILTNHADKTRTRNTLSHQVARAAGSPHHFAFPIRVQRNASFHGVFDLVEDGDDRLLERNGLDPNGAFYKMYNALSATSGNQKKTRRHEDFSDLQALITGLDRNTNADSRRAFIYDNVNLPATVNYLAVRALNSDRDHGHKNYYVYRDSDGSREWEPIIWDVDLTWGHNWNATSGYFDDSLSSVSITNQVPNNRLYAAIWDSPETRAMYLRRLRTLMDQILQPPGTTNGWVETTMRSVVAPIDPDPANPSPWTDGDRDFTKWGTWGRGLRPREETEYVIANFIGQHRLFLYNQDSATRQRYNGDPIPDLPNPSQPGSVTFAACDPNPASGNQAEEFVSLRNTLPIAIDISGWKISGPISHTFAPGTVIPPGDGSPASQYQGIIHLARDSVAFRNRSSGPSRGQRRFIQGNFSGTLPARGATLTLANASGTTVASFSYPPEPTPHQLAIRVTEIQYNPAPPSLAESSALPGIGRQEFEYLELANITTSPINLAGCRFTAGIEFDFHPLILHPGQRVLLVKNPDAFTTRYPGTTAYPVIGPYGGQLDNSGERLEISDPVGEIILDFSYNDAWFPSTDGSGRSLVLRDPATPYDQFGKSSTWAASSAPLGNPGEQPTTFATEFSAWARSHFSAAERADPAISGPHADPDGDGRDNWNEFAFATHPHQPDAPSLAFAHPLGLTVRHPTLAVDILWTLEASNNPSDPTSWSPVPFATSILEHGPDFATSSFLESSPPTGQPARFLRLRASHAP
jgi:hypothetical protein